MERFAQTPDHVFGWNGPGNNITKQMIIDMVRAGKIPRNLDSPPSKDTIVVPDAGYTLLRLKADNPGYWIMHCHMSWHSHIGMAVVFKVGQQSDIPPTPENFPKCANFNF